MAVAPPIEPADYDTNKRTWPASAAGTGDAAGVRTVTAAFPTLRQR